MAEVIQAKTSTRRIDDYGDRPKNARKDLAQKRGPKHTRLDIPNESNGTARSIPKIVDKDTVAFWKEIIGGKGISTGAMYRAIAKGEITIDTSGAEVLRQMSAHTEQSFDRWDQRVADEKWRAHRLLHAAGITNITRPIAKLIDNDLNTSRDENTWKVESSGEFDRWKNGGIEIDGLKLPLDPEAFVEAVEQNDVKKWIQNIVKLSKLPKWQRYKVVNTGEIYGMTSAKIRGVRPRLTPTFNNFADCKTYIKEHLDEIQAHLAQLREVPRLRSALGRERIGNAVVIPKDVKNLEKYFVTTFGLRAVEWGNHMTQKERDPTLRQAIESFTDLADTIGLPYDQIGLDKTLTVGFGSRGTGGRGAPMAHFDPNNQAINLTRKRGAGALAHEWFHAWDHSRDGLLSAALTSATQQQPYGAGNEVKQSDNLLARSEHLDRVNPSGKEGGYWATSKEIGARIFEDFIHRMLHAHECENSFLVEREDHTQWDHSFDLVKRDVGNTTTYPYPLQHEYELLDKAMFRLLDTHIPGREPKLWLHGDALTERLWDTQDSPGLNWDEARYQQEYETHMIAPDREALEDID